MSEKKKQKPKKILFVGDCCYVAGLPAKDMELKEWKQYPKELRDKGLKLNLYKME